MIWTGAFVAWIRERRETELLRAASTGPFVGAEYSYSEEEGRGRPSPPLVLKNLSSTEAAHNVRVLSMAVGELEANFEPGVIPFIEPLKAKEVKALITNVFPTLRHDLPVLFRRSYNDKSTEELFGEHSHILRVEYENATGTGLFESCIEFRYRPWKTRICIGETRRRVRQVV